MHNIGNGIAESFSFSGFNITRRVRRRTGKSFPFILTILITSSLILSFNSFGFTEGSNIPLSVSIGGWTYGTDGWDYLMSMIPTADGGYALVGATNASGKFDIWMVKTDNTNFPQWDKTYNGIGDDFGYDIVQSDDGGYVIVGYTNSSGAGDRDIYVIKTDQNGNLDWNKTIGGTGIDSANCVIQTDDGGYAIAGSTTSYDAGSNDFCVVKLDSDGNEQWLKTFGGAASDTGYSIIQTDSGGYAVAGSTMSFGVGGTDFWLIKLDNGGQQIWNRTYGDKGSNSPLCLIKTTDGGYLMAGSSIVKTDYSGNFEWNCSCPVGSALSSSIIENNEGDFIVTGFGNPVVNAPYDAYLLKIDMFGNIIINSYYGDSQIDIGRTVLQKSDGSYVLAGSTQSYGSGTGYDFWLVNIPKIQPAMTIVATDGTGDYTSLQQAINNTSNGGTIYIKNGNYAESILPVTKSLTVIGEDKTATNIQINSDLQINGTANYLTIENVRLTVTGNVQISGSATLNLRYSDLILNQNTPNQFSIRSEYDACLTFFEVNVYSTYTFNQDFSTWTYHQEDPEQIVFYRTSWNVQTYTSTVRRLSVINCTGLGDFYVVNKASFINSTGYGAIDIDYFWGASAEVINSTLKSVNFFTTVSNVSGFHGGAISYFNPINNFTAAGTDLTVINSNIDLIFDFSDSSVTIENSDRIGISTRYGSNVTVINSNMTVISIEDYTYYPLNAPCEVTLQHVAVSEYISVKGNSSLTASDTRTTDCYTYENASISLNNVDITGSLYVNGNVSFTCSDALLSNVYLSEKANLHLSKTTIAGFLDCAFVTNNLEFNEVIIENINIYYSNFQLYGNITFNGNALLSESSITRNYNIIAKDTSGEYLFNLKIDLLDSIENPVWSSYTNDKGKADFKVTFTNTNYTSPLTLKVDNSDDYSIFINSDNPIVLVYDSTPTPSPTTTQTATPTPGPTTNPSSQQTSNPTQEPKQKSTTSTPTPLPTTSPTATPNPTRIDATNNNGEIVTLQVGGNITSSQISSMTIDSDQSSAETKISFTITGDSGSTGLGNLTVPKSQVPYGSKPTIYVDNQLCPEQGYSEDSANYYVWWIAHFSTHQLSIIFTGNGTETYSNWLLLVPVAIVAALSLGGIALKWKKKMRTSFQKHSRYLQR